MIDGDGRFARGRGCLEIAAQGQQVHKQPKRMGTVAFLDKRRPVQKAASRAGVGRAAGRSHDLRRPLDVLELLRFEIPALQHHTLTECTMRQLGGGIDMRDLHRREDFTFPPRSAGLAILVHKPHRAEPLGIGFEERLQLQLLVDQDVFRQVVDNAREIALRRRTGPNPCLHDRHRNHLHR